MNLGQAEIKNSNVNHEVEELENKSILHTVTEEIT